MNRILKLLFGFMLVTALVVACSTGSSGSTTTTKTPTTTVAKSVALPSTLSVAPGKTGKITPIIPANTTAPSLTWSIPKAVTGFSVDQTGTVTVASTATVGATATVTASYGSTLTFLKTTLKTVVTAQTPPIGATKTVTPVASTPTVAKSYTGKSGTTVSVPSSTKIGSTGVTAKVKGLLAVEKPFAMRSLPAPDVGTYRSRAASLSRVPNARSLSLKTKQVTALPTGTAEVLWPTANTLVGLLSAANDEATAIAAIGLLAVPTSWDPTLTNAPATQIVTLTSAFLSTLPTAITTGTNPLTAGTYTLTNWDFYTLGQYELDANGNATTTLDPYYADGYNEEISFTATAEGSTSQYWLDFSDDGTQVQVEQYNTNSSNQTVDLVVETNFNLSTQSYSFSTTNADGISGSTSNFQLIYDNPTTGTSGYLDADNETIDTSGDSTGSTILSGYFDTSGAFITGYSGNPETDTNPTFIYEYIDSNGNLIDTGTLSENTSGTVTTSNQEGTDDPSVTLTSAADGSSNYYWNLLF